MKLVSEEQPFIVEIAAVNDNSISVFRNSSNANHSAFNTRQNNLFLNINNMLLLHI